MEWKEVRLGDVCTRVCSGGTPKSTNLSYYGGEIPWLNTKEIDFNRIYSTEKTITDSGLNNSSAKWIAPNTVTVAMYGATAGKSCIVKVPMTTNQACCNLTINDEVADYEFVYYTLKNDYTTLASLANGGAQQNLNAQIIKDYVLKMPSLADQRRIASILSSLDRKIELNNKINADLEEMAQAIFKNWFVDFEPFKDGKFVDSELGMIPEGWKVGSYSEMIESLISGDWGKETPQGNYTHEVACVRGCDFQDINNGVRGKTPQRYILEKNYQAKHLKDKDILVEISGGTATVSTGRTSLVTEELLKKYKHDIVCTNFCKVLRPLSQFSSYVYYSWKYKYDNDIMFGYENGTSGIKNFAIKDFIEKESVLIPKEQDIVEFQKIIDNLQKQKQIKGTENTTLSTLRDTLLPRLMSGEIEVPE